MQGNSINNLKTICVNQSNNLKYHVNMECLLNCSYTQLSETLFCEWYQRADEFYKTDIGSTHELVYDTSTRKVSKLFVQSLSQDEAEQTTVSQQPLICSILNRINNRYYLEFDGSKNQRMISDINLNPAAGEDDIVNMFIVYILSSFGGSYWTRCGVFGHDNSTFDKFVSFSAQGDLIISSKTPTDHIVIGQNTTNEQTPIAGYKSKANADELNKWVCLLYTLEFTTTSVLWIL